MQVDLTTDLTTVDNRVGTFKLRGNPTSGAAYVEVLTGGGGGGTNLIGEVGIDQTTQGVTNAVTIVGRITKTNRSSTITTGGTAQNLMVENITRLGWQLQNNSANDLWFNEIGGTAVQSQPSFKLTPGSSYECPVGAISTSAISIIGSTTGQQFTAREW